MTVGRRLLTAGAFLALAVVICYSHVWGEPARDKENEKWRAERDKPVSRNDRQFAEELAASKFADNPVVTYRNPQGETLFALQVKPELERGPARPRDILVLVDTSASQATGALTTAQKLTEALVNSLGADDRVAILTANTECNALTRGFQRGAEAQAAVAALKAEYGSGATNLKKALETCLKTFSPEPGRQQVLLFLGDGMSILDPITPEVRKQLADQMVQAEVAFFPVPLGPRPDPQSLHGFATSTGGAVVRLLPADRVEDTLQRLTETVAAPILYPKNFELKGEIAESFPTRLPPLRADAPTLVVGRLKGGAQVGYRVTGTVAGKDREAAQTLNVPEPEADN